MVQGLGTVVERFGWWGGADLVIRCGEEAWPCHRAVLAAASPVFERGLAGTTLEAAASEWRVEASPASARACSTSSTTRRAPAGRARWKCWLRSSSTSTDLYHLQELKEACGEALLQQVPEDEVVVLAIVDRYLTEESGLRQGEGGLLHQEERGVGVGLRQLGHHGGGLPSPRQEDREF